MCRSEVCGSDKVTRVIIPLVTEGGLECDKSKVVCKTNVWVIIKRKGKGLQEIEDDFKEREKRNSPFQATRLRMTSRLQTKSGLRPNSKI